MEKENSKNFPTREYFKLYIFFFIILQYFSKVVNMHIEYQFKKCRRLHMTLNFTGYKQIVSINKIL